MSITDFTHTLYDGDYSLEIRPSFGEPTLDITVTEVNEADVPFCATLNRSDVVELYDLLSKWLAETAGTNTETTT